MATPNKTSLAVSIVKLYKEGKSYKEIQAILKCSKSTISYHLGVKQKTKTQNRRRDGRLKIRKFIQEYKTGKYCTDCGKMYPYWILEFDHLHNKSFTISKFRSYTTSLARLKKEIAKCELVCANCHRNRTFHRLMQLGKHII